MTINDKIPFVYNASGIDYNNMSNTLLTCIKQLSKDEVITQHETHKLTVLYNNFVSEKSKDSTLYLLINLLYDITKNKSLFT